DHGRPGILPRFGARADRRTSRHRPGTGLLIRCSHASFSEQTRFRASARRQSETTQTIFCRRRLPADGSGLYRPLAAGDRASRIPSNPVRATLPDQHGCWRPKMTQTRSTSLLDSRILAPAIGGAFRKLDPRSLARNPVMFVVAVVAALTTVLLLKD